MRIVALSGSPKGELSGTVQYFNYIEKNFPDHEFEVIDIGKEISKIEKNPEYFQSIIEEMKVSDGIVWTFPVFVFLVPYQLKRFIELIFENEVENIFENKYGTALSTSVHFFDHTAHNYIHSVCDDLKMRYIEGFSAEMRDLLIPEERDNLLKFAENFFNSIENNLPTEIKYAPISPDIPEYIPANVQDTPKTGDKKIVLITDSDEKDTNLNRMIDVFKKFIPSPVEVVNLNEINIRGGCLSCYRCAYEGICVYKDDFMNIYKDKIMPAEAIIFAGKIRDRYLSSKWKMFFDRSFFNGHRSVIQGKQMGYIISGPLRQISNLRQVIRS